MNKSLLGTPGANSIPDPAGGGGALDNVDSSLDPTPDSTGDTDDGGGADGDDNSGTADDDIERLTADEWTAKQREGVPATPDLYEIPDIDGLDKEAAAASPIVATMREAALEAGLNQEAFGKLFGKYLEAEQTKADAEYTAQRSQLGSDDAAIERRTTAVAAFLTRTLPEEQATAVIAAAGNANVVKAIETLMSRAPKGSDGGGGPAARDDWPTIQSLMNSDAYMGIEGVRDPAIVARVDKYFEQGGKRGGR